MSITALYRDYLRNARRLPTLYLRQFFELRARDNVERVIRASKRGLQQRTLKTVERELRRLKEANNRNAESFDKILNLAYGRVGKLRWELLEPLLTSSNTPPPSPLIPSSPHTHTHHTSAPPISPPPFSPPPISYPAELTLLLSTPSTRMKRPWTAPDFLPSSPRGMPNRFDPAHPDHQILGHFDKRREVNLRRKRLRAEVRKVFPPVEVLVGRVDRRGRVTVESQEDEAGRGEVGSEVVHPEDIKAIQDAGDPGSSLLRPIGLQGSGLTRSLLTVIGPRTSTRPPLTKRERASATAAELRAATPPASQHPSRWVRRRFRSLLSNMHMLVYVGDGSKEGLEKRENPFVVTTSPLAMDGEARIPEADETSLAWIGDFMNEDRDTTKKGPKSNQKQKQNGSNRAPRDRATVKSSEDRTRPGSRPPPALAAAPASAPPTDNAINPPS